MIRFDESTFIDDYFKIFTAAGSYNFAHAILDDNTGYLYYAKHTSSEIITQIRISDAVTTK